MSILTQRTEQLFRGRILNVDTLMRYGLDSNLLCFHLLRLYIPVRPTDLSHFNLIFRSRPQIIKGNTLEALLRFRSRFTDRLDLRRRGFRKFVCRSCACKDIGSYRFPVNPESDFTSAAGPGGGVWCPARQVAAQQCFLIETHKMLC